MAVIEIAKIQVRRGLEGTTGVPQLDPGEFGWAQDTEHLYIGKRIVEGASTNANSRILTENDLSHIFDVIGAGVTSAVASTSTYRYRDDIPIAQLASTTSTIAKKLDNWVSISDFSTATVKTGYAGFTALLQKAVSNLFANSYLNQEAVRTLKIPAGTYTVNQPTALPPYTRIVGEGLGVTKLIFSNTNASMFYTVDAAGNKFETGQASVDGNTVSQGLYIADMTLSYAAGNTNNLPLMSLDNSKNPIVENMQFNTQGVDYSSAYVSAGTAISIRAQYAGADEIVGLGKNAYIQNCLFENLNVAISATGTVQRTVIENNVFTNLKKGIYIAGATSTSVPPKNTLVTKNKFTNIALEAIYVSTSTNSTNVISSENTYFAVGNGVAGLADIAVITTSSPVLTFNAPGNISSNDRFNRRDVAVKNGTFYYNPLVNTNVRINSAATQNKTLTSSQSDQTVVLIPLTGADQMGIIDYQIENTDLSRQGRLTVNISPDGYASVSDYYNYSEVVQDASTLLVFSTNLDNSGYNTTTNYLNYITVTCSNFSGNATVLEFNIDLTV